MRDQTYLIMFNCYFIGLGMTEIEIQWYLPIVKTQYDGAYLVKQVINNLFKGDE